MSQTYVLDRSAGGYELAKRRFLADLGDALASGPKAITIAEPKRSLEQNARMWAMLGDLERQVGYLPSRWRGNVCIEEGGYIAFAQRPDARPVPAAAWKDILTAAQARPRLYQGIDGGVVAVGVRTSGMTVRQMTELMDLADAFGAQHGVRWTDPTRVAA